MTTPATEWVASEHVYVWPSVQPRKGARGQTFVVKWKVAGRERSRSRPAAPGRRPDAHAEAFRGELARAQLNPAGRWHRVSGLPEHLHLAELPEDEPGDATDALTVARDVVVAEWRGDSPGNRKSRVETMACVVAALTTAPFLRGVELEHVRRALRDVLLPPPEGQVSDPSTLDAEVRAAAAWLPDHVRPVTDLTLPVVEETLLAASRKLNGKLYAKDRRGSTRGSLSLLAAEAVRRGLLPTNPVRDAKRVSEMVPVIVDPNAEVQEDPDAEVVDPERVMSADQCRAFCAEVRNVSWVSWRFAVFWTLLWTTGMRPSEAFGIRNVHRRLHLPEEGWGWVKLWRPTVDAGAARWTGTGSKHADKTTLKARAVGVERHVPLPPETVTALREFLTRAEVRPGARLFVNSNGKPFTLDHLGRVFRTVRAKLFPDPEPTEADPEPPRHPLRAVTQYELRHSYVTTALEAGIPVAKVAELVGNSVPTINRVYERLLTVADDTYAEKMGSVFQ
ncbi:tyrosine-type recombinase/integrase [Modestobacter sp. KNN46-3]|uniref:tyrosine-type recombinase/integrase n=1 Tax=Modestobacter sp. KNN46-3 TaxID=2711218 RepID=UPI0013DFDB62|nr:tyrosine-type recombinase/integrase [Modestobacter sp. KNN46-3]